MMPPTILNKEILFKVIENYHYNSYFTFYIYIIIFNKILKKPELDTAKEML